MGLLVVGRCSVCVYIYIAVLQGCPSPRIPEGYIDEFLANTPVGTHPRSLIIPTHNPCALYPCRRPKHGGIYRRHKWLPPPFAQLYIGRVRLYILTNALAVIDSYDCAPPPSPCPSNHARIISSHHNIYIKLLLYRVFVLSLYSPLSLYSCLTLFHTRFPCT